MNLASGSEQFSFSLFFSFHFFASFSADRLLLSYVMNCIEKIVRVGPPFNSQRNTKKRDNN